MSIETLLSTPDAAKSLTDAGITTSPTTLAMWRYQGRGPNYVKLEGRVFYTLESLQTWIDKSIRQP